MTAEPLTDWNEWHDAYRDRASPLSQRLAAIKAQIRDFLAQHPRETRVISVCAGDGRDLFEALAEQQVTGVRGILVELDPVLAARARLAAQAAGLAGIDVVCADAGRSDVYRGFTPADLVLLCGVFGNISDEDVERTIRALPQFCAPGSLVVWTRHRRAPDLTPTIRQWFADVGYREQAFVSPGLDAWSVGAHRFTSQPQPLASGRHLFSFIR